MTQKETTRFTEGFDKTITDFDFVFLAYVRFDQVERRIISPLHMPPRNQCLSGLRE